METVRIALRIALRTLVTPAHQPHKCRATVRVFGKDGPARVALARIGAVFTARTEHPLRDQPRVGRDGVTGRPGHHRRRGSWRPRDASAASASVAATGQVGWRSAAFLASEAGWWSTALLVSVRSGVEYASDIKPFSYEWEVGSGAATTTDAHL